jgi:hypothetical protein
MILVALIIVACSDGGTNSGDTKISAHNTNKSHNNGKNCISCHREGGPGEGWFTVAGTIYDSSFTKTMANATVKLYTGSDATGTVKMTIEADNYGNFYTTEPLTFGTGLYPVVYSANGDVQFMGESLTFGNCNSCHGVSRDKIYVNF